MSGHMARFAAVISALVLARSTQALLCLSGNDVSFSSLPFMITNTSDPFCVSFDVRCGPASPPGPCNDAAKARNATIRTYTNANANGLQYFNMTYPNLAACTQDLCNVPLPAALPPAPADLSCWLPINGLLTLVSNTTLPGMRHCGMMEVPCSAPGVNCTANEAALGVQRRYAGVVRADAPSILLDVVKSSVNFDVCTTNGCNGPAIYPTRLTVPQQTACVVGFSTGTTPAVALVNVSRFSDVTNYNLPTVSFRDGDVCVNYTLTCDDSMDSYIAGCTSASGTVVKYDVLPSFTMVKWLSYSGYVSNVAACTGSTACNAPPPIAAYISRSLAVGPGAALCYDTNRNKIDEMRGVSRAFSVNETSRTFGGPIGPYGGIMRSLEGNMSNPGQCIRFEATCVPGLYGAASSLCSNSEITAAVVKVVYISNPYAFDVCSPAGPAAIFMATGLAATNITCCNTTLCNVAPTPMPSASPSTQPASPSPSAAPPSASPSRGASASATSSPAPPSASSTPSNLPSSIAVVADYPPACFVGTPINAAGAGVVLTNLTGPLAVAGNRCIRYRRACNAADVITGACANATGMVWTYAVVSRTTCSLAARGDAATVAVFSSATCCATAACNTIISNAAVPSPAPSAIPATAVAVTNATLQFTPGSVDVNALASSAAARDVLRATIAATLGVSAANITITAIRTAAGALITISAASRRLQSNGPSIDFTIVTTSSASAEDLSANIVAPSFASALSVGLRNAVASSSDAALVSSFRGASVAAVTGVTTGIAANPAAGPAPGGDAGGGSSGANLGVIIPAVVVPVVVVLVFIGAAIMCCCRSARSPTRPLSTKTAGSSSSGNGISV